MKYKQKQEIENNECLSKIEDILKTNKQTHGSQWKAKKCYIGKVLKFIRFFLYVTLLVEVVPLLVVWLPIPPPINPFQAQYPSTHTGGTGLDNEYCSALICSMVYVHNTALMCAIIC